MALFRWRRNQPAPPPPVAEPKQAEPAEPEAAQPPPEPEIRVARTLVKSEPELAELVASDERLGGEIRVELAEKGFGTQVAVAAAPSSGLAETDLERLLDELAEPQKRPFTNT